ncbi:pilus assembly protein [Brevundimonas naejangsanensis]|uniref:Pilus assembly protein n=1 Tax=Brevundimonas naejangsanensis TaxID=588932 RepID=A0A494RJ13_9CAUL|nr:TadE/TadG family type IV pilus assembly protein [Brevundimonas naejangsanensis]AYG94470.1 pilus assembly protein [Brevundimonas naejangsanensis]
MRRPALFGLLGRLAGDRRGVSAVEFALLAPVMILIYFGLVEFCQGYMAERRSGHAASVVADLVAQSGGTSRLDLDRTFAVGDTIMRPFSAAPLSIRVSSVTVDARGVATVQWSRANDRNLTRRAPLSVVADLPPGLISTGETLILGETEYAYRSIFAQALPRSVTFRRSYYLRPRTTDRIACADCPA